MAPKWTPKEKQLTKDMILKSVEKLFLEEDIEISLQNKLFLDVDKFKSRGQILRIEVTYPEPRES